MTTLILERKFRFWALKAYFCRLDPQKYIFFLTQYKIPDRWIYHITWWYWSWAPNSVLRLWRPIMWIWPLKLYISFIYIKFPIDWWVTWPISFLSPNAHPRVPADSKFFWTKNIQHQITKHSEIFDFWFLVREHVTYV
jgi:hypothetical protein